jgi:hypothetical protein
VAVGRSTRPRARNYFWFADLEWRARLFVLVLLVTYTTQ